MRRLLFAALLTLTTAASAQQAVNLSGIILSDDPLVENTRVAIHVVDADNAWVLEVGSVTPIGGTFRISPPAVPSSQLRPFRSGSVILPGLQNEYRVTPEGANVAVARITMYIDQNRNELFDRVMDPWYIGASRLEEPVGFWALLFVDRDVSLTAAGVDLQLRAGWNVFTVRFPGEQAVYDVVSFAEDIVLDVALP